MTDSKLQSRTDRSRSANFKASKTPNPIAAAKSVDFNPEVREIYDELVSKDVRSEAFDLKPQQQDLMKTLSSPKRRVADKSEQQSLFEGGPTIESKLEPE